jgi:hypothetical protein
MGQNKSGTTAVGTYCSAVGLKSRHPTDWDRSIIRRDFFCNYMVSFDDYSDGPVHLLNIDDFLYIISNSNALFIVQYRSLKSWLTSRWNHVERFKINDSKNYINIQLKIGSMK